MQHILTNERTQSNQLQYYVIIITFESFWDILPNRFQLKHKINQMLLFFRSKQITKNDGMQYCNMHDIRKFACQFSAYKHSIKWIIWNIKRNSVKWRWSKTAALKWLQRWLECNGQWNEANKPMNKRHIEIDHFQFNRHFFPFRHLWFASAKFQFSNHSKTGQSISSSFD